MEPESRVPLRQIYRVFFEIGALSFGGAVSGWIQREVVEKRKWMTYEDFLSGIALTQIMPGPNATNSAVYVGQRLRGAAGALTALTAMLSVPFIAVLIAATTYRTLLNLPGFQEAMIGTAAAAVGILLRTSLTSAWLSARGVVPGIVMASIFVAVGILKWPMLLVICVVAPLSVALAYWKRSAGDRHG